MQKRKSRRDVQIVEERKIRAINAALDSDPVNVEALRKIAISEGLVNDGLRCKVWPKLLAVDSKDVVPLKEESIFQHKDVDQVAKDIDRSLWRFTIGQAYLRRTKRQQLSRIVNAILSRNPELHYYQGYHDIASIFLLVAGTEEAAYAMLDRLSKNHIRYALNSSLDSTRKILELLFPIIAFADEELYNYFRHSQVEPFFALSWVLTWFSHGFDDLPLITRLFDLFIASHPLMPLYVGAQIILHFRDQLLDTVECEYSAIHGFLTKLPQSLPFEDIIHQAVELFHRLPPKQLQRRAFSLGRRSPVNAYPYPWMRELQHPDSKVNHARQLTAASGTLNSKRSQPKSLWEPILFFVLTSILAWLMYIAFH